MLERVNSEVTFTVSDFLTNCDGGGRKSLMTVSRPLGASSSLLLLIELAPFSPFPSSDNANVAAPHGETHSEDAFGSLTYAKEPRFIFRMGFILRNDAARIVKRFLSVGEANSMPLLIDGIFLFILLKRVYDHMPIRTNIWQQLEFAGVAASWILYGTRRVPRRTMEFRDAYWPSPVSSH
jgi:hypothetical protein